jgi:hypothetical protein
VKCLFARRKAPPTGHIWRIKFWRRVPSPEGAGVPVFSILTTSRKEHRSNRTSELGVEGASGLASIYIPNYMVRLQGDDGQEMKLILEIKGFETEQDHQRGAAALLNGV